MLKTLENARFLLCMDHRGQVVSFLLSTVTVHTSPRQYQLPGIAKQHHTTLPQLIQGREVDSEAIEKGRN